MTEPTDAELTTFTDAFDWEGWISPALAKRAFARAILAKWGTPPAVAGEPEGWITWFRSPNGGREPIYSHGPKKPSHGAELDAKLRKYPVFTTPQPTQAQAGAVPLNHKNIEPVRRFLADRGIYLSDETTKALIVVAHGIKGGQHGADT